MSVNRIKAVLDKPAARTTADQPPGLDGHNGHARPVAPAPRHRRRPGDMKPAPPRIPGLGITVRPPRPSLPVPSPAAQPARVVTLVITTPDVGGMDGLSDADRELIRLLLGTTDHDDLGYLVRAAAAHGYAVLIRSDLPAIIG